MDDIEIKFQALITEREAMLAENQFRMYTDGVISYGEAAFMVVVGEFRALLEELRQKEMRERYRATGECLASGVDAEGRCLFCHNIHGTV